jgi:hypothetical protein
MKKYLPGLFITCFVTSCAVAPVQQAPQPTEIIRWWHYDDFVKSHLTVGMLKANPGTLCPKGVTGPIDDFWEKLAKSIAFAESGFDPKQVYQEKFIDGHTGKAAISVGLFQLSIGDKYNPNYKGTACDKLTEKNLTDPLVNLECALGIMDRLIPKKPDLQSALGLYWSTIRAGAAAVSQFKKEMPGCF